MSKRKANEMERTSDPSTEQETCEQAGTSYKKSRIPKRKAKSPPQRLQKKTSSGWENESSSASLIDNETVSLENGREKKLKAKKRPDQNKETEPEREGEAKEEEDYDISQPKEILAENNLKENLKEPQTKEGEDAKKDDVKTTDKEDQKKDGKNVSEWITVPTYEGKVLSNIYVLPGEEGSDMINFRCKIDGFMVPSCSICMQSIVFDAILSCPVGHTQCMSCYRSTTTQYDSFDEPTRCPLCRKLCTPQRQYNLEMMRDELFKECSECGTLCHIRDVDKHQKYECRKARMDCPCCNEKISFLDLPDHLMAKGWIHECINDLFAYVDKKEVIDRLAKEMKTTSSPLFNSREEYQQYSSSILLSRIKLKNTPYVIETDIGRTEKMWGKKWFTMIGNSKIIMIDLSDIKTNPDEKSSFCIAKIGQINLVEQHSPMLGTDHVYLIVSSAIESESEPKHEITMSDRIQSHPIKAQQLFISVEKKSSIPLWKQFVIDEKSTLLLEVDIRNLFQVGSFYLCHSKNTDEQYVSRIYSAKNGEQTNHLLWFLPTNEFKQEKFMVDQIPTTVIMGFNCCPAIRSKCRRFMDSKKTPRKRHSLSGRLEEEKGDAKEDVKIFRNPLREMYQEHKNNRNRRVQPEQQQQNRGTVMAAHELNAVYPPAVQAVAQVPYFLNPYFPPMPQPVGQMPFGMNQIQPVAQMPFGMNQNLPYAPQQQAVPQAQVAVFQAHNR